MSANNFPLFLGDKYDFFETKINEKSFVFIVPKDNVINVKQLEKHFDLLAQYNIKFPVLVLKNIRKERRNCLIQLKIPFIDVSRQMYIPYLGLQIQDFNIFSGQNRKYFSVSAQLTFLYLIYKNEGKISGKNLAGKLKFSSMTASRSLRELCSL